MYACGVKVRWQTWKERGNYGDGTGCDSLKLKYCHYDSWMRQSEWKGKENGHWGKKHDELWCPENYWITGISVGNSKPWFKKKKTARRIQLSWFRTPWIKLKEPKSRIVNWAFNYPDKLGIVGVNIRCSQKTASMETDVVKTRDYTNRLRVKNVFNDFPAATNKWVRDFEIRMQKKHGPAKSALDVSSWKRWLHDNMLQQKQGAARHSHDFSLWNRRLHDDIAWNGLRLEIEEPTDGMSTKGVYGYWKDLGSEHGYTYTITEGVSKSVSTEVTKEQSRSIALAAEAGFDFATVSVAMEWATMTARAMGKTFEKSASKTKEFECPSLSTNTYMWQWVFKKEEDDYGRPGWTVQSPHIRCTADHRPPKCPCIFCAVNDTSCQTCTSYAWMHGNPQTSGLPAILPYRTKKRNERAVSFFTQN